MEFVFIGGGGTKTKKTNQNTQNKNTHKKNKPKPTPTCNDTLKGPIYLEVLNNCLTEYCIRLPRYTMASVQCSHLCKKDFLVTMTLFLMPVLKTCDSKFTL